MAQATPDARPGASRVVTIAHHVPFLDQLAARWMAEVDNDPQRTGAGLILLPSRRAARALTEAFLRRADGRALLLPRIAPIAALDEAALALSGEAALELPPAVEPMRRLATLTLLVLQAGTAFGDVRTVDQAWPLARALADLMDEAEWAECDLRERLPEAADGDFAQHWDLTLKFLSIVTGIWPTWLEEQGVMNPVARQVALLHAQAAHWRENPLPEGQRLWAAGFSDAVPSTVAVLRTVLDMPGGRLVLTPVDMDMDADTWAALPPGHPQAGTARMLADLGVMREELEVWDDLPAGCVAAAPPGRATLLSNALLPAPALGQWLDPAPPPELQGLSVLHAADQQEEAAAIALILRQAIERPGQPAALVTPDRALAGRVATELARWGVIADDSAGEGLATTPQATFLRLIVQAVDAGLSPVALLSMLKHPLAACGLSPGNCRASARLLERAVLRGPAPPPGIAGLRAALSRTTQDEHGALADAPDAPQELSAFLDRLERALDPLLSCASGGAEVVDLLSALVEAAQALAATDTEDGAARLWSGEEGNALGAHLAELLTWCDVLPAQRVGALDGLLASSLAGVTVRGRRALRGREQVAVHPRVFIWGLLEARLQTAGTIVLGGLVETVWPPATDPGPWMSRPMRTRICLPSPECAIGQAAHDFIACACAAPNVVLSVPGRRQGAPAVAARWLVRLDAYLSGRGAGIAEHPALSWLEQLDRPSGAPAPVAPPRPCPPVSMRPRSLSVTEIETWMRDPYAIYARRILGLKRLADLEEMADAADYGEIVHDALDQWFTRYPDRWPADGEARMVRVFAEVLEAARLRPALAAWWAPRLERIARWCAATESGRRGDGAPRTVLTELSGRMELSGFSFGTFVLRGRADRIDRDAEGGLSLFDYKTGTLPTRASVLAGWQSQLVLEAAMIEAGGFAPDAVGHVTELVYWRLTGGHVPAQVLDIARGEELSDLIAQCRDGLRRRVAAYDTAQMPYLSHPHPGQEPRFADYAHLARVAEWSAAREEDMA
ncbi:double-strand break repair protein AddB [Gluconacetobacter entanii]|uniref:double-strand break repair protein AddB n=1 Tax=Gluconacetobacter entanii TaxID=108528 RepID=UPI001C932123|nr:double-strand break repair protein AddB [Gluconacetobacter entanii]MBY4639431.1 double-strand break repair protein AddB [Gluconacetobacter entanii]MCW4581470.1 double-strand break repair protein AddB [Gluconacetobacter entanii]MCW4584849.1 double-strand break repair protein AddB [Gluconacetobacter entanii]MCW4588263.1 double-strand break repair protein AddB [Gluconacetobacter entanii]